MLRKNVIVDTNALLIPGEFGVDIFEELERLGYEHIIVPEAVLSELDELRRRPNLKGKEKRAANIGYSLVLKYAYEEPGRCMVTINKEEEEEESGERERERDVDELIVKMALKHKAAVLTSDEPLRRKLSKAGIATVYLRGKSRLEEK
ncbi:MAG: PIN domain-containing protein [Euryarchaeota archaeon]|nr:PIN domain-containing protein [Euryarchaeota archaeon]